jgi:anaerobic selenocysteine-containing dehydrogenase
MTMQMTRRDFIALLAGGVAGVHITPLPWKLTDDIAIWTQNWPWVPVPPVGAFEQVKSVCRLCPGGCGIAVRKVDTRAVKIEGRTDYPVNPGGICPLGSGGLQLLYNEDIRFTSPMKRVGPRGAGQFADISWDEALDMLGTRISTLRDEKRPEAVAAVDGNRTESTMSLMVQRLLTAIGSPNYMRIPTIEDTYRTTNLVMQGRERPMAYDLENADFILSFGAGLLEGWGAPGRVINAWRLWHQDPADRSAKIVHVESRASNTASKADQWIAAKPGTDAALALGLAHVIIKEGLYNSDFVKNHTAGFDGGKAGGFKKLVLEQYDPAKVGEITGLSPEDVVALAKAFAGAKAPLAVYGKGKGSTLNGSLYESMAVLSLNALVGNINRPGGVLVCDPLPLSALPEYDVDAVAREGLAKPRLDGTTSPQHPLSASLMNSFTDAVLHAQTAPVDTLLVFSSNPAFTSPDAGAFTKALKKIPFIVSFSPYRDETANMADLVLPDHNDLEKMDDVVWPTGLQYPLFGLSAPVVEPLYKTKHAGDTVIELAQRIGEPVGAAFPWDGYEEVLQLRAKGLFDSAGGLIGYDEASPVWQRLGGQEKTTPDYEDFDDMWEKIRSGGLWYRPGHQFGPARELFDTPTGKFEFVSTQIEQALSRAARGKSSEEALKSLGIGAKAAEALMPHYEGAAESEDYPLRMVPYELVNLASGWLPNPPHLNKTLFDNQLRKDESFAEINPATAGEFGLREGDRAILESPRGKARVRVTLFEGAMPGIIYLPLGLGHEAYDEFSQGKGINPMQIVLARKDPLGGHSIWWDTPVKLTKV